MEQLMSWTAARQEESVVCIRAAEVLPNDVGQRLVRMPAPLMQRLGLAPDDIVELTGRKTTGVRVAPLPATEGDASHARVESAVRHNAGVDLGDELTVRVAETQLARSLVLVPEGEPGSVSSVDVAEIKRTLAGTPVTVGDRVRVQGHGAEALWFEVSATAPRGIVLVSMHTKVALTEPERAEGSAARSSYDDIGGLDDEVRRIREVVELPIRYPELFRHLGVDAPRGVLLHGPPGTGKTLIARAVAGETSAHFIHINGPEILNKLYGESEARLREIFDAAQRHSPSIIFIDEIDAIAPRRTEVFGDVEKRIVAQLLALMDGLKARGQVIVIGATNVPDAVDPALRRSGRFDRELSLSPPDRDGRAAILQIHTRSMPLDDGVDIERLADVTHGFVGADLAVLCKEAAMSAIRRFLKSDEPRPNGWPTVNGLETLRVTGADFDSALRDVEPTAVRELFAEKPSATWGDVGGLAEAREQLQTLLEWMGTRAPTHSGARVRMPRGVVLTGPPGSGKTLLVHAMAGASGAHFISVDAATLHSRWQGEAERGIRQMFKRAKQIAPCIVFFDELDAIAPARGRAAEGAGERLVSQLCVELDHLLDTAGVLAVAATNRPDRVDPALLRSGRFDLVIELPLPDRRERGEILRIHTADLPLAPDVDLDRLAQATSGASGADLAALCRNAMLHDFTRSCARQGNLPGESMIEMSDFMQAMEHSHAIEATPPEVGTREQLGVSLEEKPEDSAEDSISTEEAR
jgi:transitional endoplasmic reticulum ATPase